MQNRITIGETYLIIALHQRGGRMEQLFKCAAQPRLVGCLLDSHVQ